MRLKSGKLLTKDKLFVIPNFAEEAEMLEWAGISFGEENTLRLQKSIKVSSFLHVAKHFLVLTLEASINEWS